MNQREQVAVDRWRLNIPPKRRLTKYLHGATFQRTAFFTVTAVKTSNLTYITEFTSAVTHVTNFLDIVGQS
jgi:hypothetical protein